MGAVPQRMLLILLTKSKIAVDRLKSSDRYR
jgi:hypothetical protein